MGDGLTPKQAAFCMAFIETGNASEAYRQAYDAQKMKPETVNRAAKELLDNPKITARLSQLNSMHAERHKFTVDDMIAQLDEDRAFARELEKPSAAVSASMGKARVYGFLTDKVELSGKVEIENLTDAEIAAKLAEYGVKPTLTK